MYPDLSFESATFSFRIQKLPRPHVIGFVAYLYSFSLWRADVKYPDSPDACGGKPDSEKKLPFKNIRIRKWGGSRKFRKKEGAEPPTLCPPPPGPE